MTATPTAPVPNSPVNTPTRPIWVRGRGLVHYTKQGVREAVVPSSN